MISTSVSSSGGFRREEGAATTDSKPMGAVSAEAFQSLSVSSLLFPVAGTGPHREDHFTGPELPENM